MSAFTTRFHRLFVQKSEIYPVVCLQNLLNCVILIEWVFAP